ncbi:ATP-binding cassette domain-containing protein [Amycolatopsis sp. PS_44_ISF1]|uniref:ATP-binding cassette domain-containing protein n=1 Tax=Amycolatopsis sp. PS_44_ISF1 TaxID=2974917 RepID=UPI0028DED630|nr:ATP-binding cassette domain-containing protein [Amycolatopsis sp. PS_44_ISF1]MDT8910319.1 ATP-binding cassette domain-containing protein [Amycolatopsis sp. PS_44_ISF1]
MRPGKGPLGAPPALGPAARRALILVAALSVVHAAFLVAQAFLLADVLASIVSTGIGGRTAQLAALFALVAGRALTGWAVRVVSARAAATAQRDLRARVVDHALRLGPEWLARSGHGELTALVTRGLDALDAYFREYLPALVTAAVVPLAAGAAILWTDWPSALIVAGTVPLLPMFAILVGKYTADRVAGATDAVHRMSGQLLELVRALPVLAAFRRAEAQAETVRKLSERHRRATLKTLRVAFSSAFVLELAATLSVALVAVVIGVRLVSGSLPLAIGLGVLILVPECYQPLRAVGAAFHSSEDGVEAVRRVTAVLAEPVHRVGTQVAPCGSLMVSDLSVARRGGFAPDGETFSVRRGETVWLRAPSGGGKSTTLATLLGFVSAYDGSVTIGDEHAVELADVDLERWRRDVAWVPQSPVFSGGTVREELAPAGVRSGGVDEAAGGPGLGGVAGGPGAGGTGRAAGELKLNGLDGVSGVSGGPGADGAGRAAGASRLDGVGEVAGGLRFAGPGGTAGGPVSGEAADGTGLSGAAGGAGLGGVNGVAGEVGLSGVAEMVGRTGLNGAAGRVGFGGVNEVAELSGVAEMAGGAGLSEVAGGTGDAGASGGPQLDGVDEVLAELGLDGLADRPVERLSLGQRQRVAVARALVKVRSGAWLLLLDEPTAHLDEANAARVLDAVQRAVDGGAAAVIAAHERTAALDVVEESLPHNESRRSLDSSHRPLAWRLLLDRRLFAGAALGALALLAGVALTATSGWLIATASLQPPILTLTVAVVGVRAFGLGRAGLRYVERLVTHDAAFRISGRLRVRLWESLVRLGPARGFGADEGQRRLVADVDTVRDLLPRVVSPPIVVGLVVVSAIAVQTWVLPSAGLVLAGAVVLGLLAPAVALRAERRATSALAAGRRDVAARVLVLFSSSAELLAYGTASARRRDLAALDERLAADTRRQAFGAGAGDAVIVLATGVAAVVSTILAGQAVATGRLSGVLAPLLALVPLALAEVLALLPPAAAHWDTLRRARLRLAEVVSGRVLPGNEGAGSVDGGSRSAARAVDTDARSATQVVDAESGSVSPDVDAGSGLAAQAVDAKSGSVSPDVDAGSGLVTRAVGAKSGSVTPGVDSDGSLVTRVVDAESGSVTPGVDADAGSVNPGVDGGSGLAGQGVDGGSGSVVRAVGAGSRLVGAVDTDSSSAVRGVEGGLSQVSAGGVRLRGAAFGWPGGEVVLHGVDLEVEPGSYVAVVGASGAGKSTLVAALLGFLAPREGNVVVPERVAWAPQGPMLVSTTVAENLRLANPTATEAELRRVLKLAELPELAPSTMLDSAGTGLSGGQAQRVAFARALLAVPEADLVLLDEPTAHLDEPTARALRRTLRSELAGRTVVHVTHTADEARTADIIYEVRDGRVRRRATPATHVARGPGEAQLCAVDECGVLPANEPPGFLRSADEERERQTAKGPVADAANEDRPLGTSHGALEDGPRGTRHGADEDGPRGVPRSTDEARGRGEVRAAEDAGVGW